MKKLNKLVLLIALVLFVHGQVLAWGQTGHRVVGKVAENHLSKKAQKGLWEIMGHESLADASTWMDNIKSDPNYRFASPWHYVTVPDGQTYATAEKSEDGDVYEATQRMIAIIKSDTTKEAKKIAVRMLVHLVGDFHQPLHVGNGEDRGGNSVKIKWFGDNSNLHRIWDSEIIDSKQLSYMELTVRIDHVTVQEIQSWQADNLDVWVDEAMALRPQIYDIEGKESLSYEYMYKNWDTVQNRLLKAGIRLAGIFNEIFA